MTEQRRRFKQTRSLKQRLLDRVRGSRDEAKLMNSGFERETVLKRAREAETGSHQSEWLRSRELGPPE